MAAMPVCPDHRILERFIDKLRRRYGIEKLEARVIGGIRVEGSRRRVLYIRVPEEIPVYSLLTRDECVEQDMGERVEAIQEYMWRSLPGWLELVKEASRRLRGVLGWPAKSLCMDDMHCIIKFLEETRRIGGLIYLDYLDDYKVLFVRVLPPYMPLSAKIPSLYLGAGYLPIGLLINLPVYEALIPMIRLAPPGRPLDLDPDLIMRGLKTVTRVIATRYGDSLKTRSIITVEPSTDMLKHIDYPLEELRLYITAEGIYFAKPENKEYVEHTMTAPPVSPDMLLDYMSLREAVETTYPPDTEIDLKP